MRLDVVSIFPEYLAPLRLSLVGKAIENGVVELVVHDLRDWTHDRHRRVDDTPYGGGAGMVMKPEPWGEALDALVSAADQAEGESADAGSEPVTSTARLIVLTPSGQPFTQRLADELATERQLIFACGRYEGIDARVMDHARTRMRVDEVSIGDYVLNGGEVAAMVIIESVVRLIPGVLGNPESLTEESHSVGQDGLLEYPVFTKPPTWRGLDVPEILFSGHHGKIAGWRREQALERTRQRRPDLLLRTPGALVVTDAALDDAGELFTLQRAAFLSEGQANESLTLPPMVQTYGELHASLASPAEGTRILVARRDGRLVGSVRGEPRGSAWHVGRLMVAPDLQGQGLGSRLLCAIEAAAPAGTDRSILVTGVKSVANVGFYGRRGYVETRRRDDEAGIEIIIMTRPHPT